MFPIRVPVNVPQPMRVTEAYPPALRSCRHISKSGPTCIIDVPANERWKLYTLNVQFSCSGSWDMRGIYYYHLRENAYFCRASIAPLCKNKVVNAFFSPRLNDKDELGLLQSQSYLNSYRKVHEDLLPGDRISISFESGAGDTIITDLFYEEVSSNGY